MKEGKTLSFIELIEGVDAIQIPILQRDYAQGRQEQSEVRRQFLRSIKRVLLTDYPSQPLDLDFVYGTFEEGDRNVLSVLDGQQRLTTLFLLHWYLATKDGKGQYFRQSCVSGQTSKFTYKTRISASEFFDALARASDIDCNGVQDSPSDLILDKAWFFASWRSDPTVQACLTMLDSIHQHFFDCGGGLYDRLTDKEAPCIAFQYLNLDSFGLSDELYIRMNARGKPLSDFENFKAWLYSQLEKLPDGKRVERKIDQEWTDLFWNIGRKPGETFDTLYLRFFNLMAFYQACESLDRSFDTAEESLKEWVRRLRGSASYIPTDDLEKFNAFDRRVLRRIEVVLDYFVAHQSNAPTLDSLRTAIRSHDYVNQTKFYAYVRFIEKAGTASVWTEDTLCNWSRWTRVTNNLINNYRIDELSPFIVAIRSLAELSSHSEGLYEFLAEGGLEAGFTREQRQEESLKARLILANPVWEDLLIRYESHSYLQGKVGFVIKLVNDDSDVSTDPDRFDSVARKVSALLGDKMLNSSEHLLERALLSLDDYLVQERGSKYTFCIPSRTTYRERSENWLRVVTAPVFTRLVNCVGDDVALALREIIEKSDCDGWRRLVVNYPETIDYCGKRLVHKDGDIVYLLSKATFGGYHSELRTFVLDRILRTMEETREIPAEITEFEYVEVYGDDIPCEQVTLNGEDVYNVAYDSDGFYAWMEGDDDDEAERPMPAVLSELLRKVFPEEVVR